MEPEPVTGRWTAVASLGTLLVVAALLPGGPAAQAPIVMMASTLGPVDAGVGEVLERPSSGGRESW
jgi:hypothetical protein